MEWKYPYFHLRPERWSQFIVLTQPCENLDKKKELPKKFLSFKYLYDYLLTWKVLSPSFKKATICLIAARPALTLASPV